VPKASPPPGDGIQKAEFSGGGRLWGKRVTVDEDDDIGCRNSLKLAGATGGVAVLSGWKQAACPALAQSEARTSDRLKFTIIVRDNSGCDAVNYTGNRGPAGRAATPTPLTMSKVRPSRYVV
jgi:hypothetical protein